MRQVNIRLAVDGHRLGLKGVLTVVWESEMSQALCLPVASILSPFMQVDIHRNGSTVRGQKIKRCASLSGPGRERGQRTD